MGSTFTFDLWDDFNEVLYMEGDATYIQGSCIIQNGIIRSC